VSLIGTPGKYCRRLLKAGSKPEILAMVQSLQLGGTGKTVALSFDVPEAVFELLGQAAANRAFPGK